MRRPPGGRRSSRLHPGACAHAGVPLRSALLLAAAAAVAAAVIEARQSLVASTAVGALPVEQPRRWRQRQLQQQGAAGGHSRSALQRPASGGDPQRQTDEAAGTGHAQQGRAAKRRSGGSKLAQASGTADAQAGTSAKEDPQSGARASGRSLAAFQKQVRLSPAPAPGRTPAGRAVRRPTRLHRCFYCGTEVL